MLIFQPTKQKIFVGANDRFQEQNNTFFSVLENLTSRIKIVHTEIQFLESKSEWCRVNCTQ